VANPDDGFPRGGLGSAAAKGALITISGQVVRLVIQILGIVLLARLLSPSDFGLLAMVIAIIGVGEVVRDFGLSSAAVQATSLSKEQRDNLFWINAGIGLGFASVVVLVSGLIADFYSDSRLQPIALVLSTTFIFNGLSTQFRAHLNRQMKFGSLAFVETASAAIGLAVGVAAAFQGAGYWALVLQQAIGPVVGLVAVVALARWWPGPPHRHSEMTKLLRFGSNLVGVQLLNYASRNIDSIVVGVAFGPSALGFYDRAFQLLMLPLNQMQAPATKVALPTLAKLQTDPTRFASFLTRGQLALMHVIVVAFAFSAAQASPLILLVLGSQWLQSVPIFQVLAVAGVAQAASYATYWAFLSLGLTGSNLRLELVSRPLVIALIFVGSFWGVLGVAAGFALGQLILWPFGLWWISRQTAAVPSRTMFSNGLRAITAYGLCGVISWLISMNVADFSVVTSFLVGTGAFITVFFLLLAFWPSFRGDVLRVFLMASLLRVSR
jgi:PST family polysaccharide transporter